MLQEVEEILRAAFQPPEPPHVDIFGVAAQVARGKKYISPRQMLLISCSQQGIGARPCLVSVGEDVPPIVPNEDEFVPQHVFIAETQQFLLASAKSVMVLGKRLSKQRYHLRAAMTCPPDKTSPQHVSLE